jgi:hypothetical protein
VKERKSARIVAREKEKRKLAREALSRWKDPPNALERFRETIALVVGHTSHGKAGTKFKPS